MNGGEYSALRVLALLMASPVGVGGALSLGTSVLGMPGSLPEASWVGSVALPVHLRKQV